MKMFDAQISPIVEYASEVWYQNKDIAKLEKIHLTYIKSTLKVKTSTSTVALYTELGRFPISLKIKYRVLNYWRRITALDMTHPVRQAYEMLYKLHESGQTNWCSTVKSILCETNNSQIWNNQTATTKELYNVKEQTYKLFMDQCINKINDSDTNPKLRTFKLFKDTFRSEPFIVSPTNINHTLALIKFRISAHNLAIETGRYTKPKTPIENRTCIHCTRNEIESEQHFLLSCPLYNNERHELFLILENNIDTLHDMDNNTKFINIMSNRDIKVTNAIGKYIFICLKKRNEITI